MDPLLHLSVPTSLVIRPDIFNWGNYHGYHWHEFVSVKNVQVIDDRFDYHDDEDVKYFATALGLKEVYIRYYSIFDFDRAIRTSLQPVRGTLNVLDIQVPGHCANCLGIFDDQDLPSDVGFLTDFHEFSALTVLRIPAVAFFENVGCTPPTVGNFASEISDRTSMIKLLPPLLRELEIRFAYPTGVFARGLLYMRLFRGLSEDLQMEGFGWILQLLQKRNLKKLVLNEDHCIHGGGDCKQRPCEEHTSAYTPPGAVVKAFRTAKTELQIRLLDNPCIDGCWESLQHHFG